jgi:hypothetical protein
MRSEYLEIVHASLIENLASMVAEAIEAGNELETADLIDTVRRALLTRFGEIINSYSEQCLADMETAAQRLRERAGSSGTRKRP